MYQWVLTQYIGISILIFVCLNLFLATVVVCSSTWDALHQGITGQRGLVERYSAYTGWIGIPRTLILWDLPFQWLLYNDAKRHFRQIHPCLSSFERTNEKLCRKRTIPPESANRKIEGKGGRLHLQFSRAGFGCCGPWGNYLPPYLLRPRSSNLNVK